MDENKHLKSLNDFRSNIWHEIELEASTNHSEDTEEFLNLVTNILIEAGEFEDFNYVPYEGLGKRGRRIQIDGYSYSDVDDCLCIFITTPLRYEEDDEPLITTEANKYLSMAAAFLDNAEYVEKNAEESSPGYGFAVDVVHKYKDVLKYKIFLISDQIKSKSLTKLDDITARGKSVECHVWDISRIFELSNSARAREEIVISLSDYGIKGLPCILASETSEYKAYLCNIPGLVLANLYNQYGGRLLEGNVRSFLQVKGNVNKGIRRTILTEPEMFFAYNNGIAATAYDAKVKTIGESLFITELSSLQIVNGGQTTASLAAALIKDKKDNSEECISKIFIPMKLSIVLPEKADKLIGNIARYANSQNKVSAADLWSNHPYHIKMEEFSRRLVAPATNGNQYGTYWYYERANGQYAQETYKSTAREKDKFEKSHPKNQKITKTELAKYMLIFEQRPHIASKGGQKAFIDFATSISENWEAKIDSFNEEYFRNLVSVTILFRTTDSIVRQLEYKSYKANIVAYALSKIFYTVKKQHPKLAINLKTIWQKQSLSSAWVEQIKLAAHAMYDVLVGDREVENVTEWAKYERCWEKAKNVPFELLPEFIDELQWKEDANSETRTARAKQKMANSLQAVTAVAEYGSNNWSSLLDWDESHKVMNPNEIELVQLAQRLDRRLISKEWDCKKVLQILEKCRLEGFPG
jgi:hypothetical protein